MAGPYRLSTALQQIESTRLAVKSVLAATLDDQEGESGGGPINPAIAVADSLSHHLRQRWPTRQAKKRQTPKQMCPVLSKAEEHDPFVAALKTVKVDGTELDKRVAGRLGDPTRMFGRVSATSPWAVKPRKNFSPAGKHKVQQIWGEINDSIAEPNQQAAMLRRTGPSTVPSIRRHDDGPPPHHGFMSIPERKILAETLRDSGPASLYRTKRTTSSALQPSNFSHQETFSSNPLLIQKTSPPLMPQVLNQKIVPVPGMGQGLSSSHESRLQMLYGKETTGCKFS